MGVEWLGTHCETSKVSVTQALCRADIRLELRLQDRWFLLLSFLLRSRLSSVAVNAAVDYILCADHSSSSRPVCRLSTDEDGFAHNKFWVTDRAGQQLRQSAADLTAERLGDYLVYCTPSKKVQPVFQACYPVFICIHCTVGTSRQPVICTMQHCGSAMAAGHTKICYASCLRCHSQR